MVHRTSTFIGLTLIVLLGVCVICGAQEDTWTKKADMPIQRYGHAAAVADGIVYVIGGTHTAGFSLTRPVDAYDPSTDTWSKKSDIPTPRFWPAVAVVDGAIYVIGGLISAAAVISVMEAYDPATGTWTKKADMPTARYGLSASVVNGKIYAMGGWLDNGQGRPVSSVEAYDPVTDTWTTKTDMPTARGCSTAVVDEKNYAVGGLLGNVAGDLYSGGTAFSIVERYDPATDTWIRKSDMPTARGHLATSVVSGKIYAIGGVPSGPSIVISLSTVEVYNPMSDTWERKSDMPTPRAWLSTGVINGQIYAIGGTPKWPRSVSSVEEYNALGFVVKIISPLEGGIAGDKPIAISGIDFPADAVVTIGGNPLAELMVTDNLITGLTPPGTAGRKEIRISIPDGRSFTAVETFRYTAPSRPVAVSITPTSGLQSGGQPGVIEGAGFQPGLTVTIGLAKATDVVVTDTKITFTIPESNRPGTLVVVVENPGGGTSSRLMYTYISLPEIGELQPNKGPVEGGTQVTLFGKGFLPDAKVTHWRCARRTGRVSGFHQATVYHTTEY